MTVRIVEIVGPPGSGKSSLVRSLTAIDGGSVRRVGLRGAVSKPALMASALRVGWPFFRQLRRIPARPGYRFKAMVQLQAYRDVVGQHTHTSADTTLVLDQGPVYLMAIVKRAEAADGRDAPPFARYWQATIDYWARTLDAIVVLDAADEVLLDRIRSRGTPHPLLDPTTKNAGKSLAHGRSSMREIAQLLNDRPGGPELVELRTDTMAVDALTHALRTRIERKPTEPVR